MKQIFLALAAAIAASAPALAQSKVTVTGGAKDESNVIVTIPANVIRQPGNIVILPDGMEMPASSVTGSQQGLSAIVFSLPSLKAGETKTVKLIHKDVSPTAPAFHWEDRGAGIHDLQFGDKSVLRYMGEPHDTSTKDRHELTFKIYHHVFEPEDGKTLLTNGAGLASDKNLLYPHHRGIFFAFNKVSYGGEQSDIWHGRNGEFQEHEKWITGSSDRFSASQQVQIGWHGKDGTKFAEEIRKLTAYKLPGGTLIDFDSELSTTLPKVRLDGDPQHAGFHFRACQEVNKNKAETYYLRPDGKGKLGETRNWDPKTRKGPINLPWDAMSFVIGGKRYTCLYLDHPGNPKEARGSEREYGRFGNYFEYDLTPDHPLKVHYRLWIQAGEMTGEQCESMSQAFIAPPKVVGG
jgi:hypothetical protein